VTINLAIVGVGYWGPNLLRAVQSVRGAQLRVVCDSRPEALASADVGGARRESAYQAVLSDPEIHAVMLATPVHTHFSLASAALEAGKHVFVEKPLARTSDECRTLVELATARRLVLMCGHVYLYNAAVRKVKELLDQGVLGRVLHVYSERLNLGIVRKDVNALWNVAPHDVSMLNCWFGSMPRVGRAHGFSYLQPGIEDIVFATLEYPNGVSAHLHVSWIDPIKSRRTTIVGSERMLVYDDMNAVERLVLHEKSAALAEGGRVTMKNDGAKVIGVEWQEPLKTECQNFIDCVSTGDQPLSHGTEALRVVTVLEALTRSMAKGGTAVSID